MVFDVLKVNGVRCSQENFSKRLARRDYAMRKFKEDAYVTHSLDFEKLPVRLLNKNFVHKTKIKYVTSFAYKTVEMK